MSTADEPRSSDVLERTELLAPWSAMAFAGLLGVQAPDVENGEPLHAGSDGHVLAIGDPARLEDVLAALGGH